jgi:predicted permease
VGALAATLAAGLMPALAARRTGLTSGMAGAGRGGTAASRGRLTRLLVASQVTLAVVLLIVAGLLTRSLAAVQRLEAGFDVSHLLTARVALPAATDDASAARWFAEAIERSAAIPGAIGAAGASRLPFAGSRFNPNRGLVIEGRADSGPDEGAFALDYIVTPGYFETMKLPLREGRELTLADGAGAPLVVIVSETLAKRFWPDRSPLGARLRQGDEPPGTWRTVVGVAGDVRNDDADQPPLPYLYLPLAQQPQRAMTIIVRTAGAPDLLADTLRRSMAAFDRDQPLFDVRSMEAVLDADLRQTVVLIQLLNSLAVFALGLAALGIWGVVSQLLAERTREIGVRIALGARASQVVSLVARLGLLPVALGLLAGLVAGLGVARLMRSLLFHVTPGDPLTLAGTCLLLTLAAGAALVDPIRRALKVDPMEVLRVE